MARMVLHGVRQPVVVPRRMPVRIVAPVEHDEQAAPPVKLTPHEAILWYRLRATPGDVVPYQELLTLGWGRGYNWNDPDADIRDLNRNLVRGVVYIMRRLLLAQGDHWRITGVRHEGLRLERAR